MSLRVGCLDGECGKHTHKSHASLLVLVGVECEVWAPIIVGEKWLKEDIYIRYRAGQPPPIHLQLLLR